MKDTLHELGFINSSEGDITGYYKTYKGYRLFIGKHNTLDLWFAGITIGRSTEEISIPFSIDEQWVMKFDEENNGY